MDPHNSSGGQTSVILLDRLVPGDDGTEPHLCREIRRVHGVEVARAFGDCLVVRGTVSHADERRDTILFMLYQHGVLQPARWVDQEL